MSKATVSISAEKMLKRRRGETLPFVSVILPVYNDAKALRCCLHSLQAQIYPPDRFEVVVVDNGSQNDDPRAVVAEFPGYRYSVETKVGSDAARNRGISLANGEAYAFIDSDCIASPTWLEEGARTLLTHPECGLVGGRVDIFVQNPERPTSVELYDRVSGFRFKDWIEQMHRCGTGNLFVWSKVFDTVGLFNESFRYGGDFEWSGRVHKAGLKLIYNEKVSVRHPARRTWHEIIEKKRRATRGQRNLALQRDDSNIRKSLLRKIFHTMVPRISLMHKYCSNDRLKSRGERLRVAFVFVICHYVAVWERIRLKLRFKKTRLNLPSGN